MSTRDKNGRFVPGTSGNPSGVRRDAPESPERKLPTLANLDGWASALTGIGTHGSDKRESHHFHPRVMTYQEAIALWRGDDIAARAVEALPAECFRQGYEITIGDEGSYDDLKELVEEQMHELRVDEIVERAYQYERAYGGGAILLGVDDSMELDKPLDLKRVKSLDSLTVLEPIEIYPASYYQDPKSKKYGEPEYYRLQAFTLSGVGTVIGVTDRRAAPPDVHLIHESRLIVFGGIRVSRYQRNNSLMGPLWGDSMLIRIVDILRDFNVSWASAGLAAVDFAQTVISMENLMALVANNPQKVVARMKALELSRSTARALLIDTREKVERQSTSLNGLPQLLEQLSRRLCAAIDMPMELLFGDDVKAIGKDGSGAVRLYYDRVRAVQRRRIGPVLRFLASVIMQTVGKKKLPKKWGIKFNELWQLTDGEKAEARLTLARADSMYIKMGAVYPDEIRQSRFVGEYSFETQVDESKEAPGIEEALPTGVPTAQNTGAPSGAGAKPNPNQHVVRGYARRNPKPPKGAGPAAPEGGDVTKGGNAEKRDGMDDGGGAGAGGASGGAGAGGGMGGGAPQGAQGNMSAGPGVLGLKRIAGMNVRIENPKGSVRHWVDTDGTAGQTTMKYDYGYVENTAGADGDAVDCYVGPDNDAEWAYVIHQNSKASGFTQYDEDKVMLGYSSPDHAQDAYMRQYDDERFFGGMSIIPMEQFRRKVQSAVAHKVTNQDDAVTMPDGGSIDVQISNDLAADYPPSALAWIRDVEWTGPERVPLAEIDYENKATWHATEPGEQPKVDKFAERIATGWEKPILLLSRPGKPTLMVVDGHHRAMAYYKLGRPALAYVGAAPTDSGPWDEFHAAQHAKADKDERRRLLFRVDGLTTHLDHIVRRGGKWVVTNNAGDKTLGSYATKTEAERRLRQVEYFKNRGVSEDALIEAESLFVPPGGWTEIQDPMIAQTEPDTKLPGVVSKPGNDE